MIAKYRKTEFPGGWWLTDFTMEQVEGRLSDLENKNSRLQAELAEIKQSHIDIINEPCAGDEVHCTCVPTLRAEIKRLQAEVEQLNKTHVGVVTGYRDRLIAVKAERDKAQAELERVKKLYDEWGFKDAPCPKHSKEPLLVENNCAYCRSEKLQSELEQEKVERLSIEYDCEFAECKMSEYSIEIDRLQAELERVTAERDELKDKLGWENSRLCDKLLDQEVKYYKETEQLRAKCERYEAALNEIPKHGFVSVAWEVAQQALADAERKEG